MFASRTALSLGRFTTKCISSRNSLQVRNMGLGGNMWVFAKPDDLAIDLKKLPAELTSGDFKVQSPIQYLCGARSGEEEDCDEVYGEKCFGIQSLDKDKIYTTGELIKLVYPDMKMYGYMTPDFTDGWESFLRAILDQNPEAKDIEFHFFNKFELAPYYFRAQRVTRGSYQYIDFSSYVGTKDSAWCFTKKPITEKDYEWRKYEANTRKNKAIPKKLKFDKVKYEKGYKTNIPQKKKLTAMEKQIINSAFDGTNPAMLMKLMGHK